MRLLLPSLAASLLMSATTARPSTNIGNYFTPFVMLPDTTESAIVSASRDRVKCELSYNTKPLPVVELPPSSSSSSSENEDASTSVTTGKATTGILDEEGRALLKKIMGTCTIYDNGNFAYEICPGGRVRQGGRGTTAGGVFDYLVGTYDESASSLAAMNAKAKGIRPKAGVGYTMFFTKGDKCGEPEPLRRAEVSFHCGNSYAVLAAEEKQICSYSFAVSHPALCDKLDMFPAYIAPPPPATNSYSSGYDGGNGGGSTTGDSTPLDIVQSLPLSIRSRLTTEGEEVLRTAAAARATTENQDQETHASSGLSEADIAGAGGKSMGLDDRERHGGHWSGIKSSGGDGAASWALDVHAAWPEDEEDDTNVGLVSGEEEFTEGLLIVEEGEEIQGKDSEQNDKGDVSSSSWTWTCTAYATDDLRKGTEVGEVLGGGGGRSGNNNNDGSTPQSISLRLAVPVPVSSTAEASTAQVISATARSANRQPLPVEVSIQAPSGNNRNSNNNNNDDSLLYHVVTVTVSSNSEKGENERGLIVNAAQDASFVSVTFRVSG